MLALSSILLFIIARLFWQDKHAAFIPVVWMTSPFVLWFLNQPNSEMPFFSSFFASLLLAFFFVSGKWRTPASVRILCRGCIGDSDHD